MKIRQDTEGVYTFLVALFKLLTPRTTVGECIFIRPEEDLRGCGRRRTKMQKDDRSSSWTAWLRRRTYHILYLACAVGSLKALHRTIQPQYCATVIGAAPNAMCKPEHEWLRRRAYLLYIACTLGTMKAVRTIPDVQQWYTGVGYFSDPKGKPGYFHYLVEVYRYIAGAAMLRMKEPSVEAIEASANPANGTPEDGVVVGLTDQHIEFQLLGHSIDQPKDGGARVGIIVVPGAQVSSQAYSPLARELASKGYPSFILRLPFGTALYGMEYALDIMMLSREQGGPAAPTKWVMIGHSMGGIGILNFVHANPGMVSGVVCMGVPFVPFPAEQKIPVLFIRGSRDPCTLGQASGVTEYADAAPD